MWAHAGPTMAKTKAPSLNFTQTWMSNKYADKKVNQQTSFVEMTYGGAKKEQVFRWNLRQVGATAQGDAS